MLSEQRILNELRGSPVYHLEDSQSFFASRKSMLLRNSTKGGSPRSLKQENDHLRERLHLMREASWTPESFGFHNLLFNHSSFFITKCCISSILLFQSIKFMIPPPEARIYSKRWSPAEQSLLRMSRATAPEISPLYATPAGGGGVGICRELFVFANSGVH